MNKKEKLLARPVESDTQILNSSLVLFKEFMGLMELWHWEGVTAQSIVLLTEDYKRYPPKAMLAELFSQMKLPLDPKATVNEVGDYVFINFDFSTD